MNRGLTRQRNADEHELDSDGHEAEEDIQLSTPSKKPSMKLMSVEPASTSPPSENAVPAPPSEKAVPASVAQ